MTVYGSACGQKSTRSSSIALPQNDNEPAAKATGLAIMIG